jgi:hypothetical protein
MATLTRESDGEGHYGSRVEVVSGDTSLPDEERITWFDGNSESLIGNMLLVGTATAGTYSTRDWWRTNIITEIISENEDEIRFNTASGSTYTFRR